MIEDGALIKSGGVQIGNKDENIIEYIYSKNIAKMTAQAIG